MSVIEEVIKADQSYADQFTLGRLPKTPARKLAVVACMDCRLTVEQILGLQTGDAHIIRNAGGIITEDALRSLIISHHMLGTQEVMIINHTDCGMMTFTDDDLRAKLQRLTGACASVQFHAFTDLAENIRRQIDAVKSHPWIPPHVVVRGFVYDVHTANLHEVLADAVVSEEEKSPPSCGLSALAPLAPLADLDQRTDEAR